MRFDEFVLTVPGEDEGFRIRFHEHLTVLAGVCGLERQALLGAIVGALTGEGDLATLTCVDHTDRSMELVTGGGRVAARYVDDGSVAPIPIGWFAPDAEALRDLVVLTADDLGPNASSVPRDDDPPELSEARETLRQLDAELDAATDAQRRLDGAVAELAAVEARILAAEGDAARREYARALNELERVRAEAAALQSGGHGADTDRHLLASAEEARGLAATWAALASTTGQARLAAAGNEGIEDIDVTRLAEVPPEPPRDLGSLVAALTLASDHVAALEDRLRVVASASLPEPDDARVLRLAAVDQDELWGAHARLVEAQAALEREQVAMGGIGADGDRAVAIEELEEAHAEVEAASNLIAERRVPVIAGAAIVALSGFPVASASPVAALVLCVAAAVVSAVGLGKPWRARTAAERREASALALVGVPTYLGFHLRRVDATIDPRTLDRLSLANAELEAAGRSWSTVSGGIDGEAATALEAQVRQYAAALATQHGAVQELSELRHTLDELALPDLAEAREKLLLAVEPYGLGRADLEGLEPELVAGFVAGQVALGHDARRQQALRDAEVDEEKVANRLDEVLARLGFADGALDARVGALEWAVERAREREVARVAARPPEAIEADLTRLNAEVRRLRRPEWTEVSATDAEEPDVDELIARRDELSAAVAARPSAIDLDRLNDRHAAVERRVTALEVQLRGQRGDDGADVDQLQQYLLAALTRATHVGPRGEPVPVLLDDPFLRVPAERKWELMDMLRRLSEKTQLLYLTDDPFVGAWARRRADSGAITLLEPVE